MKVVVSYGHGINTYTEKKSKGVTVGGVQYAEHTHNAEVGTRITKILRAHGVQVLEVQPAFGRDVPLDVRTDAANKWGADLYWSVHANAGTPAARGWCAFYWGTSPEGKRAAELYAKHVGALGLPFYSGDGIYPSQKGTWSDFHELRETNMVAILGENGFMTNAQDFEYIFKNKDNYYDRIAEAQAKAILEYGRIAYKPSQPTVTLKEENTLLAKAVVYNSLADVAIAEYLAERLGTVTVTRSVASRVKVAKELIVVGGAKDGLQADTFMVLSGADRFETVAKVGQYLKK